MNALIRSMGIRLMNRLADELTTKLNVDIRSKVFGFGSILPKSVLRHNRY